MPSCFVGKRSVKHTKHCSALHLFSSAVEFLIVSSFPKQQAGSQLLWLKFFLVSWHINLRGLFNAKAILVEEQELYYLIHSWGGWSSCCYILTFWPGQKCHSKVMQRKEVTHSNGSDERKSRGRKLADEMGRAKKFPWYTHRLMHRKRVTCELHDRYFRLLTIKHSISKIEWASNDYITQLSSGYSWVQAIWVEIELETEIDEMW